MMYYSAKGIYKTMNIMRGWTLHFEAFQSQFIMGKKSSYPQDFDVINHMQ